MSKIAVYTSIFGPYDGLISPPKMSGVDFICFTDQPFRSKKWKIEPVEPVIDGAGGDNRRIKMLPHLFLPDHEITVYIDGNFLIKKDLKPLLSCYLNDANMAIFDHNQAKDARNCVYKEYEMLLNMESKHRDPNSRAIMSAQIERYREEGYPENNGLIFAAVLIRKHHAPDVIEAMNCWWDEFQNNSKRDQLSFDYVRWKTNLNVNIIPGDLRRHEWFHMLGIHRQNYSLKLFRYRLKKLFRLMD